MDRLPTLRSLTAMLAASVVLAACGGGSHATIPSPGGGSQGASKTLQPQSVTFVFTVPKNVSSLTRSNGRSPQYVSSATKSISIAITDVKNAGNNQDITPGTLPAALVVNVPNGTGSAPGSPCISDPSNAGNYKCTASDVLYVGKDSLTIKTWDTSGATGNVLSAAQPVETVVQGVANTFAVALDANASTMTISGTAPCTAGGSIGSTYGSVGTTPATFNVSYTDPATKTIVSPGQPALAVTTSGVSNGALNVSVNQSAQTFTVTPTQSNTTGTVNVTATPANAGDGLSFNQTKSFTFSTGPAPTPPFLAVVEGNGTSNQVNFYQVTPGADGGSSSISAGNPATLAQTTSQEGGQDVDNPQSVVFDNSGDLLIANGGQTGTGGDYGNLACIPAGDIASGANGVATTVATDLDDPDSVAYDTRNGSVGVSNESSVSRDNYDFLETFSLTNSSYVPNQQANTGGSSGGSLDVIDMPSLTAGTFAATEVVGSATDVAILGPTGSTSHITSANDSNSNDPVALGWDSANSQLVVANGDYGTNGFNARLNFYTVGNPPATPTDVKSVLMQPDNNSYDCPNGTTPCSIFSPSFVAVGPDGTVAVAGANSYNAPAGGGDEIQLYTGSSRTAGQVIPFDQADTQSDCLNDANNTFTTNYYYDGGGTNMPIVTWMTFLTQHKLLVLLNTSGGSQQGIYIFDLTTTQSEPGWYYDYGTNSCYQPPAGPKQTGFYNTSNRPHGGAYLP